MIDLLKSRLYNTSLKKIIDILNKLKIKPNQLTTFGLLFGILAAFFIYKRFFIISVIFIILSTFCDMFDGWLARATKQETKFGKIYDVAMDKYVEGFIGLSLAFIMPPFILSGYVWAILGTFGSIIISVISNAALQVTNEKVFKFMSRSDRGLILVLGLLVASQFGDIILTYTAILLTLFSHLTIVLMLFS